MWGMNHPDRHASGAQIAYLRRLLHQAFAKGIASCYDVHHLERVTRGQASAEIDRLKVELGIGGK